MMKHVVLAVLLVTTTSSTNSPATGVYSDSGDTYAVEVELDSDRKIARFEFNIKNDKLLAKQYFTMDNIDYSFNDINNTLSFFEKPHPKILQVRNYLLPLGQVDIPFIADWTEEGDIVIEFGSFMIKLLRGQRVAMNEPPLQSSKKQRQIIPNTTTSNVTSIVVVPVLANANITSKSGMTSNSGISSVLTAVVVFGSSIFGDFFDY